MHDPDPDFPGDVGRLLAADRLAAIRAELGRRARVARLAVGVPRPGDAAHEEWRRLAGLVRDRCDVRDVLAAAGVELCDEGATEGHAPCPICGGTDRLVVRFGPPGRVWCRACAWGGDVIEAARTLLPGCAGFPDAVRTLAGVAGTPGTPAQGTER